MKKSTSHGVKTDMTPAYAAAMDPGGKFIMVTPSKIAMILLIVKTEEFRENDETTFDEKEVHESAKLKIREEKLVNAGFFDYYDESHDDLFDANILKNSTARRVIHNSYTVRKHPIQSPVCLIEEKFLMLLLKYLRSCRFLTVMQFMIGKRCSSMLMMKMLIQMLPSLTLYFSDASYISSTCKTALIGCHPQSGGIYRLVEKPCLQGQLV